MLDEIRLAVGEACARAVALHRQYGLADLIQVEMSDGENYTVRVTDRAPVEAGLGLTKLHGDDLANESLSDDALTTGVGFALLAGLVDELHVTPAEEGAGTEVRMSWPLRAGR